MRRIRRIGRRKEGGRRSLRSSGRRLEISSPRRDSGDNGGSLGGGEQGEAGRQLAGHGLVKMTGTENDRLTGVTLALRLAGRRPRKAFSNWAAMAHQS